MSPNMICKFNSFFEFSHMYSRENNSEVPETFPLANATEIVELDPEDIILPVADDPNDFITSLNSVMNVKICNILQKRQMNYSILNTLRMTFKESLMNSLMLSVKSELMSFIFEYIRR